MHMKDWTNYRAQIAVSVGHFGRLSPDTVKGYGALSAAGSKTNHLDARTRELISLAVAVSLRCDGCIATHTEAARRLGISKEEMAEALSVAVAMNAGATIIYSVRTLDAFEEAHQAALAD